MTIKEVYDYFKSWYQIYKQVGFCANTPKNWRKKGFIPADSQLKIERYTEGKLKFRSEDIPNVDK